MNRKRTYILAAFLAIFAVCVAWAISFTDIDGVDMLSLAPANASANSSNFVIAPYIQKMSSDAVTIMWQAKSPEAAVLTIKGAEGEKSYAINKGKRSNETRVGGLIPAARYTYSVKLAGDTSPAFASSFQTFPTKLGTLKFIAYGDSRSGIAKHKSVLDAIAEEKDIAFVLHTGDIVDSGRKLNRWSPMFFQPAKELIAKIPFYFVLGNHEDNSPLYFQFFSLPGNERYYSFDVADIHVIGLDSCSSFAKGSAQYNWLISDLEQHKKARWKFVFMHHPTYSSGTHAAVDDSGLPIERGMRTARTLMPELANKYGITAVFGGHDHTYERSERDGVQYIVTGGGGAGLYSDPYKAHNPYRVKFYSTQHYCILTVSENKAEMVVKTPAGKILDRVNLR